MYKNVYISRVWNDKMTRQNENLNKWVRTKEF
jgi:hypothetical protein